MNVFRFRHEFEPVGDRVESLHTLYGLYYL